MAAEDPVPHTLSQRLANAGASYASGDFAQAQAEAQAVRELLGQLPATRATSDIEAQSWLLELRCESRAEQFNTLIVGCSKLLETLPRDRPSAMRADVMVLLSYGELQLSNPEAALGAAFLAVQDALALDDRSRTAQALDRVALSYLWMGDGALAERFMLEAIGFAEQAGDADTRLLRISNAIYLLCTLHDAMLEQGDSEGAAALLQRGRRVTLPGEQYAAASRNHYLCCMWRANMARWLRRTGQPESAADLLAAVRQESGARGWYAICRPMQLEQAQVLEQAGALGEAVSELEAMFEPRHVPMRDPQALLVHERLERLYLALGQNELAGRNRRDHEALLVRYLRAVARVQQRLPQLGAQINDLLAEADRKRLQSELARLRQLHRDGLGMVAPGHEWHRHADREDAGT